MTSTYSHFFNTTILLLQLRRSMMDMRAPLVPRSKPTIISHLHDLVLPRVKEEGCIMWGILFLDDFATIELLDPKALQLMWIFNDASWTMMTASIVSHPCPYLRSTYHRLILDLGTPRGYHNFWPIDWHYQQLLYYTAATDHSLFTVSYTYHCLFVMMNEGWYEVWRRGRGSVW